MTVHSQVGYKLLVAEAMETDGSLFLNGPQAKQLSFLKDIPNVYWFSRLNVPRNLRRFGYGRQLLKTFLSLADVHNATIVCFPSPSDPNLSLADLVGFYVKYGMTIVETEDILVYHPNTRKT